jgi:hypothetical protein
VAVEFDGAAIGLDQAGDHVKYRGLAGAVRAEQTDGLAAADIDADAAHDLAAPKALFHAMHSQIAGPLGQPRRGRAIGLGARRTRFFHGRRLFRPGRGRIQARQQGRLAGHGRRGARNQGRFAHRACQHVAHGVAERGDVPRERANPAGCVSPGGDGTC